jgi:hypothetical protein
VQVPGCPTCGWVWSDDNAPGNQRGGRWVPDNYPPTPGGHPWGELGSRFEGWPRALDIDDGRGRKNGGAGATIPMEDQCPRTLRIRQDGGQFGRGTLLSVLGLVSLDTSFTEVSACYRQCLSRFGRPSHLT